MQRRHVLAACGALATTGLPGLAAAQAPYRPLKPVRFLVPYAAGGSVDSACRLLAAGLSRIWGQTAVVENRPGAGGVTGLLELSRANPDGLTLGYCAAGALAIAPHLRRSMPYDPFKDLTPVSQVLGVPEVIVAHPGTGWKTLPDLVARAKAQPGQLNFGSAGNGTVPHLGGELIRRATGIDVVHVPYKGSGPALNDLLAGQIQFMVSDIALVRSHILAGRLTCLAVAHPSRVNELAQVPTTGEAGWPSLLISNWQGLVAPGSLPPAVAAGIHAAVREVLGRPDLAKRLDEEGVEPVGSSPAEFGQFMRQESQRWSLLVKQLNLPTE